MDIPYMEPVRDGIVNVFYAMPRPVKYGFIPQHEECPGDTKYNENNKSKHAKETKRANEPSREGELHPHEDCSLYSGVYPPDEPYKAIFIR
jgi:hypothetical protein